MDSLQGARVRYIYCLLSSATLPRLSLNPPLRLVWTSFVLIKLLILGSEVGLTFMSVPRSLQHTLSGHTGPVNVAVYSAGAAKYCLTGGQDRTVRLWNPSTGLDFKCYKAHGYEVLSLSWYISAIYYSIRGHSSILALKIMRDSCLQEGTRPCSTGTYRQDKQFAV
jgi:WD40 repeat protein